MNFSSLRQDFPASVVVFFVAVPLCLGIALASGAPLFSGLIAGIVGGLVVGAVSGSHLGVSGPAAGLAVIVLAAIGELGFQAFLLALVVSGLIQVALGLARAGFVAYFFPSAVIKGMLAGIGIIIFIKQIPHALGHSAASKGESLSSMVGDLHVGAIVVSVVCLAILILWETVLTKRSRIFKIVPGPLVAVAFGIIFQLLVGGLFPALALSPSHLVSVPIASESGGVLALLTFPDWSRFTDPAIYVTAITLAVVASLETLLCVEATDKLDPEKRVTPTNRELVAQGVGNSLSGLIGGLPVTQVIVRSSANIQSGGRTKLSAILHGALLLFFVLVLPHVLNLIPLAVLASILLVVGFKLARPSIFKAMFQSGMTQFLPFVLTVVGIVFTDLLLGIGLGLGLAILMILRQSLVNSHTLHTKELDGADRAQHTTMKLAEQVTFLNRGAILKTLNGIPDGTHVVIDATETKYIDPDIKEVFADFRGTTSRRDISYEFQSPEPA